MQVIDYYSCDRPEHWLEQIKKSDWGAGQFLYELLSENKFKDTVGEKSKVLMLVNKDELISFCTYAEIDDIQPTVLTPWIGFAYTFPQYRGHRYLGKLFQEIEKLAKAEKVQDIFISTYHTGLYEKYGCEFYQMMNDMDGKPSRVYRKRVNYIDFTTITACGECCVGCRKKETGICKGCIESDGHCEEWAQSQGCPIYKCAREHNVQFCGLCKQFPCEWLIQKVVWRPNVVEELTELAKLYYKQSE